MNAQDPIAVHASDLAVESAAAGSDRVPEPMLPVATITDGLESQPWKRRAWANLHRPKGALVPWPADVLQNLSVYTDWQHRLAANLIDWVFVSIIGGAIWTTGFLLIPSAGAINFCPVAMLGLFFLMGVSTLIPVVSPILSSLVLMLLLCHGLDSRSLLDVEQLPLGLMFLFSFIPLLVDSTYHAVAESSAKQATLGKSIFHLHVADNSGKRLTLWRAYLRYFAKALSSPLFAGYAAIGMSKRHQGFHDMIARTVVLKDFDPKLLPIENATTREESGQILSSRVRR
jgi:uncharacterized RDD family membrane protein YckC